MPLTKSAKKALRVSVRRKGENDLARADLKGALKGARLSIRNGADDVADKIKATYRALDLAAKKNVIHKGKADRLKSRLIKAAAKAETAPAPVKKTKKAAAKSSIRKKQLKK